ncbi:MAG TPA: hypothetical protein VJS12_02760 [Steroidobacteraceae bacterium]|nr:hypothetical protein [Steroidobacteraceae bacterium]
MSYRLLSLIGAWAAVAVWAASGPALFEMTRVGEMSLFVLVLFFAAVVALLVAALRVQFRKNGRVSFALHIVFACAGVGMSGMFLPRLPLALGLVVAIGALVVSFMAQPAAATGTPDPQ